MARHSLPEPVALLGGTGRIGPGLAARLAGAGVNVLLGSRDAARAATAAAAVAVEGADAGWVRGGSNDEVAHQAGMAIITVPYDGMAEVLRPLAPALAGKVVISTVVPVRYDAVLGPIDIAVGDGSAAQEAAVLLPDSLLAAALHTVSSAELRHADRLIGADVPVCSDDEVARAVTFALVELLGGARPVNAGGLLASRWCEHLTLLLISVNRANKARTGVRFTGLPEAP